MRLAERCKGFKQFAGNLRRYPRSAVFDLGQHRIALLLDANADDTSARYCVGCIVQKVVEDAADTARVYGFRLKEDGAGFAMDQERLLLRCILVVGLTIAPDGAMYVTDWINGWETKNSGRIWRVDAPAAAEQPHEEKD